jgi:predicted enzyme related to lactoylglutathione lyase
MSQHDEKSASNAPSAGAVLYVKDLTRLSRFYEAVAGITMVDSQPEFVVLEARGFQLVIVKMPQHIADSIEISDPPARREDTPIKLIFLVPSIAQARASAQSLGGELNPPEREWLFKGARVCDGHDPEGNIFQLRETQLH